MTTSTVVVFKHCLAFKTTASESYTSRNSERGGNRCHVYCAQEDRTYASSAPDPNTYPHTVRLARNIYPTINTTVVIWTTAMRKKTNKLYSPGHCVPVNKTECRSTGRRTLAYNIDCKRVLEPDAPLLESSRVVSTCGVQQ